MLAALGLMRPSLGDAGDDALDRLISDLQRRFRDHAAAAAPSSPPSSPSPTSSSDPGHAYGATAASAGGAATAAAAAAAALPRSWLIGALCAVARAQPAPASGLAWAQGTLLPAIFTSHHLPWLQPHELSALLWAMGRLNRRPPHADAAAPSLPGGGGGGGGVAAPVGAGPPVQAAAAGMHQQQAAPHAASPLLPSFLPSFRMPEGTAAPDGDAEAARAGWPAQASFGDGSPPWEGSSSSGSSSSESQGLAAGAAGWPHDDGVNGDGGGSPAAASLDGLGPREDGAEADGGAGSSPRARSPWGARSRSPGGDASDGSGSDGDGPGLVLSWASPILLPMPSSEPPSMSVGWHESEDLPWSPSSSSSSAASASNESARFPDGDDDHPGSSSGGDWPHGWTLRDVLDGAVGGGLDEGGLLHGGGGAGGAGGGGGGAGLPVLHLHDAQVSCSARLAHLAATRCPKVIA